MCDNNLVLRKKYIKNIAKKIEKLIYQLKLLKDTENNIQTGGILIHEIHPIITKFNSLSEKYNTMIERFNEAHELLNTVYKYITEQMIPNLDGIITEHNINEKLSTSSARIRRDGHTMKPSPNRK